MTAVGVADRTVVVEEVMGTVASLDIRDPVAEPDRQAAAEAALNTLHRIDQQFSSYRPTSEVSRYASGQLTDADLSHDLREVLRISSVLSDDSNGVFRPQRPESRTLDVAGHVKGWAIDRAGASLRRHGMRHWCLIVGGEVLVSGGSNLDSGRAVDDELWRVAVRDPFDASSVRAVLSVANVAVATSGSYERDAHIWDGRSGRRVLSPGSFTVVGPFMTYADAYATVGYVLGSEGLAWVARHRGYEALRVAPDGSLSGTQGMNLSVNV